MGAPVSLPLPVPSQVPLPGPGWGGVALWLCPLHDEPSAADRAVLSADELARAARFHHAREARRHRAAHAALRSLLGAAVGAPPAALVFAEGPRGKPHLATPAAVDFNLSHSGDWALVGLRCGGAIGVDIEVHPRTSDLGALVRRLFTAAEQAAFACVAETDREAAFLRAWTRKEACMKALGLGLHLAPAAIDAGCDNAPRRLGVVTPAGPALLEVASLDPGVGAQAAVALVVSDGSSGPVHAG